MYSKLQYISQGNTAQEQLSNITQVLDAGCTWVQLRFKNASATEVQVLAEQVKTITEKYKATFIINDHTHIAKAVQADGVHLGLSDMSVTEARSIIGSNKIIGGTANTVEHVQKRIQEKCNYIGLGPFRFTHTKKNLSPVLGLQGIEDIIKHISLLQKSIPVYAIGGITQEDITAIMQTGVFGIAISGDLTQSKNKKNWINTFNNSNT